MWNRCQFVMRERSYCFIYYLLLPDCYDVWCLMVGHFNVVNSAIW